jgi:uncharacterized protein
MQLLIEFDPQKSLTNEAKHGHHLSEANSLEWDAAVYFPDTRQDYGEPRMVCLGYIGERLMCAVFVDRVGSGKTVRRMISLRKANLREVARYAKA